jgi:AcrR family transcriptional regulator
VNTVTDPTTKRLSPEARRQQILNAAIDYFAEAGFAVQTRELTRRIGVSQPLLYRYFPSKAALIEEVLEAVFLRQQNPSWLNDLRDRSRPIKARLMAFYGSYVESTYDQRWLRIYFFAALANFEFNGRYVKGIVEDKILQTVCTELRDSLLSTDQIRKMPRKIHAREIELAWMLQSNLFYGMVRKHILNAAADIPEPMRLSDAVDLFISGAQAIYPTLLVKSVTAAN